MHPAKSVITFTLLSGMGYGLLMTYLILGLEHQSISTGQEILIMSVAFLLIITGLLSATFHLGHPERAWRALSQWRTSWLSREGVSAVFLFIPWGTYLIGRFYLDAEQLTRFSAIMTCLMCLLTVYTTSMIYRTLKAVQSWYNLYVSPLFILFSLSSGLVLLNLLLELMNLHSDEIKNLALITVLASLLLKRAYWRNSAKQKQRSTLASATGLGKFGEVSVLEKPTSHDNYLMQEMGFGIARKHSLKLRKIFQLFSTITAISLLLNYFTDAVSLVLAICAFIFYGLGLMIERWLFFAEAKHDQALYYQG